MNYVDLHSHILPGIDDGAVCTAETFEMLRIAYASGTRGIVATPHMFLEPYNNNDPFAIGALYRRVLREVDARKTEYPFLKHLKLYIGSENYVSAEFMQALEQGRVLPFNSSRYLLIELPSCLAASQFEMCLKSVLDAGFLPVVAHIERSWVVQQRLHRFSDYLAKGCVFQVNASSLLASNERRVYKTAWRLLKEGLAQIVASDGHRPNWRTPQLRAAASRLKRKFPEKRISEWLTGNPSKILRNEPIS